MTTPAALSACAGRLVCGSRQPSECSAQVGIGPGRRPPGRGFELRNEWGHAINAAIVATMHV